MDNIKTVISRSLRPLIFIFAACLVCIDTANRLFIHDFSVPFVTAFLISLPTAILPGRLRIAVQLFVVEAIILLCIIDSYCLIYLGSPISPQILPVILQSNSREAGEFFSIFIGYYVFLQWRIMLLLLLAILFPLSYVIKVKKVKKWETVLFGLVVLLLIYDMPSTCKFFQLFRSTKNIQVTEGFIFRHYHEAMSTPIHRLAYAWHVSKCSKQVLAEAKHSTLDAAIDSCLHISPHIILIIGESYNKHHSSLYGYGLPTTPLQERRRDKGELFVFEDVVTPWNITSNVFWEMFSLWEHGAQESIGTYPLFPIFFQHAGYDVNFFSNQYMTKGLRKRTTSQAGSFFLADKELNKLLFSYRNKRADKYDMGLVKQVAEYKNNRENPRYSLDIVHLIGQHFDYAERYPRSYSYFTRRAYDKRPLDREAKRTVMHYDNATRYNDIVLDSLLTIYDREEAVVLFVADHGEEVYDGLPVHGRLFQESTAIQAQQEFEIPMWIWCSEKYCDSHPEIVSHIKKSLQKPFMTDGIPQILLWLAGIKCRWTEESRNLLSPHYQCKKRIISGTTDYDSLMHFMK